MALFGELQKHYQRQRREKQDEMLGRAADNPNLVILPEETPKTPSLLDIIANTPNEMRESAAAAVEVEAGGEVSNSQRDLNRLISSFGEETNQPSAAVEKEVKEFRDQECSCDLLFEMGVEGLGPSGSSRLRDDFDRLIELQVAATAAESSEHGDRLVELSKIFHDEKNELIERHRVETEDLRGEIARLQTLLLDSTASAKQTEEFGQQFGDASASPPSPAAKKVTFVDEQPAPSRLAKFSLPLKSKLALVTLKPTKTRTVFAEKAVQTEATAEPPQPSPLANASAASELVALAERNKELEEMVVQLKLIIAKIYASLISN